jgi:hypothetical protein
MTAAPELAHARGEEGIGEVLGGADPEYRCGPDSDVCERGKVKIDLRGIEASRDPIHVGVLRLQSIDVGDHQTKLVGDHGFLHYAQQDPPQSQAHQFGRLLAVVGQLEFIRSLDRPRRQLGEESDECNESYWIGPSRVFSPIHVDHVSGQLKGIVGNSQGLQPLFQ